eukprot:scaffold340411_cov32-Prasinocladus_malaysianus.AAC.1
MASASNQHAIARKNIGSDLTRPMQHRNFITLQRLQPFVARHANAPWMLSGHQMDCSADQHVARPPAWVHISQLVPYRSYLAGTFSN